MSFAIIPFSYSQIVDQPDVAIGNIDLFGTVALGLPAQQSFEAEITGDLTKIELSVYGDSKMDIIVEMTKLNHIHLKKKYSRNKK